MADQAEVKVFLTVEAATTNVVNAMSGIRELSKIYGQENVKIKKELEQTEKLKESLAQPLPSGKRFVNPLGASHLSGLTLNLPQAIDQV